MIRTVTEFDLATVQAFAVFVAGAKVVLGAAAHSADDTSTVTAFERFVESALPLVLADIRFRLPLLADRARLAERWIAADDLLLIGGYQYAENAYTKLMGWASRPDTHRPSAEARQRAWLDALGFGGLVDGYIPADPRTQLRTDDGVPDLVLRFGPHAVCVEAKTGSAEHATPSGKPQTVAYPDAVRRALDLPADGRVFVAFVTLDGRAAANPEAASMTYAGFALAMIRGLDGFDIPPGTWAAYVVLFTHFFGSAVPAGTIDLSVLVRRVADWSRQDGWDSIRLIRSRQGDLLRAIAALVPEETT